MPYMKTMEMATLNLRRHTITEFAFCTEFGCPKHIENVKLIQCLHTDIKDDAICYGAKLT